MATAASMASNFPPLPDRLMRFFAKYPPAKFSAYATNQRIPTLKQRIGIDAKPLSASTVPIETQSSSSTNESISGLQSTTTASENEITSTRQTTATTTSTIKSTKSAPPNPFLPRKNHETGRWSGARIGLRTQADLFKLARMHGVEELLPPSIKSADYKQRRVLERGLQVKGTGEGQRVKGHIWERQKATTIEKRRKAMEEMPEMIRLWKQTGHGRGWKKYPK